MSRHTEDREDLLRDATALTPRGELRAEIGNQQWQIFFGFRKDGALSLYFGGDPVYHFNTAQELRRAFVDDHLLKAERGHLIRWHANRTAAAVTMERQPLAEAEERRLCTDLTARLQTLAEVIAQRQFDLVGQVPADGDAFGLLATWLQNFAGVRIADSPRVR